VPSNDSENVLASAERGDGAEVRATSSHASTADRAPAPQKPGASGVRSERAIVLVVAAVQFVNILDFMMVMPLGPDFAKALGIPMAHIGYLGGAYTVAAAVAGIAGSFFLDRFDRRTALAVAMLGLVIATAAGGFATGFGSLVTARVIAGAFGGPATAIALAIVSDVVPPERRGRAMGAVMTAFSVASILGVPAGLRAATLFGWRAPFFAVAGFGLVLAFVAVLAMPSLTGHRDPARVLAQRPLVFDRLVVATLGNTALVMLGLFAVIPNISTFLQQNLGYPRERLDVLYFVGGLASVLANRPVGTFVDRLGATRVIVVGTFVFATSIFFGFVRPVTAEHVIWIFPLLMLSASLRGVPMQTLATRVPAPAERARFMSAQSAVQHLASAAGAFAASAALSDLPDGRLGGMTEVALAAIGLALFVPFVSGMVERGVIARERVRAASSGA
jgi:predicted MFS family arabinose efflux permease